MTKIKGQMKGARKTKSLPGKKPAIILKRAAIIATRPKKLVLDLQKNGNVAQFHSCRRVGLCAGCENSGISISSRWWFGFGVIILKIKYFVQEVIVLLLAK